MLFKVEELARLQITSRAFRAWVKKFIEEARTITVYEWSSEAMAFLAPASRLRTLHMPFGNPFLFFDWFFLNIVFFLVSVA